MIKLEKSVLPSSDLAPFIVSYNFYSVEADGLDAFMVPEGAIELVIQRGAEISQSDWDGNTWTKRDTGFIGGLHHKGFNLKVNSSGNLLSIRFKPGAFSHFIWQPTNLLVNTMVSLQDLWGEQDSLDFIDQIQQAPTSTQQIAILERVLRSQYRDHDFAYLSQAAVDLIHPPFLSISDLSEKYNLSKSRFRELFGRVVGCSPKQFFQTRRINAIIGEQDKGHSLTKLGLKFGYYDQAHFIRDFKAVTGCRPSAFSRNQLMHDPAFLS